MNLPYMTIMPLDYINKKKIPQQLFMYLQNVRLEWVIFLNAEKENRLMTVVTGKRKGEVGQVVLGEFSGRTKK